MLGRTILEIPIEERERMLSQLRQARYGYLLGLHILLLCAKGRTPSEVANSLFCSRSNVYRTVAAYQSGQRLAQHPRFELVFLPSYCPRANPIERAFGDVHDKCTRNHKRTGTTDLVADVVWHLKRNGLWRYRLSGLYYAPEVDAAMAELLRSEKLKAA